MGSILREAVAKDENIINIRGIKDVKIRAKYIINVILEYT